MQKIQPNDSTIFSAINLPTLPQTLIRLMEVCNDPEADIVLVAKTVAQDVSIASKILKLANSAFLGTRSKFINIEQAVIYLGIDTVRNLAISVSVHETFQEGTHFQNMNIEEFWYHSLLTALLAKEIAELIEYDDPAEAYLAGLLHDIGKCLLNESFPDQYSKLLGLHGESSQFHLAEKKSFGVTHADAGAWLAQHWHLKTVLAQAISLHHTPLKESKEPALLERVLFLANALAVDQQLDQNHLEEDAKYLQLERSVLPIILTEQKEVVMEIAGSLGIKAIAPVTVQKPVLPDATKSQSSENLKKKVKSLTEVHGILDNLVKAQTLNRVFLVLEESIQILFDSEKCILLLPDEANTKLSSHGSFRNRLARSLRKIEIPLHDSNLRLYRSIQTRNLISIGQSSDSPIDDTTAALLDTFNETSLFALSFIINDTQRGILVLAPSRQATISIAEQEESLFMLCSHVGSRLYLENLKKQHAESLARERIATMEEVARSLAHEISNPLSIIQNYISLLANREGFVTNMQEELNTISREIERIGNISKQLNDLSAVPDTSGQELTDIYSVIKETLHLFRQSAMVDKNVSINFQSAPELPDIWTKPDSLRQILNNLLSNSLDAVGTGGKIEVMCSCKSADDKAKAEEIIIEIADDGPGINPAIAGRLFRAGQTTKGKGHAGLGLAIVRKLTSDLAGKIYHSTDKDGQTLFTLRLPVKNYPSL